MAMRKGSPTARLARDLEEIVAVAGTAVERHALGIYELPPRLVEILAAAREQARHARRRLAA